MAGTKWDRVSATTALDNEAGLEELVGQGSAIYMWKRNFVPASLDRANGERFLEWMTRVVDLPIGVVESKRISHFLTLHGIQLSGGISNSKEFDFASILMEAPGRKLIERFLRGLADHAPALYVGESSNLAKRVRQHISESTDFGRFVGSHKSLGWSDLDLYYHPLSGLSATSSAEAETKARRAVEYLAATVTVAGFTQRPG